MSLHLSVEFHALGVNSFMTGQFSFPTICYSDKSLTIFHELLHILTCNSFQIRQYYYSVC